VLIQLPDDVIAAPEVSLEAKRQTVPASQVPTGQKGLDIGPRSVEEFARSMADAATILWNGPMGVFELEPFSSGTRGVATAIAGSKAYTVAGGGDSLLAIRRFGLEDGFDHLSTGGGASLEFLEGRELPGVKVLEVD
jgi:phosphoglycerate kinase